VLFCYWSGAKVCAELFLEDTSLNATAEKVAVRCFATPIVVALILLPFITRLLARFIPSCFHFPSLFFPLLLDWCCCWRGGEKVGDDVEDNGG